MDLTEHIILCGIKHAGKTSAAKALAALLRVKWLDSDDFLQSRYNEQHGTALSVREIYRTAGADLFRRLEADVLAGLFHAEEKKVIALGGGALSNPFFPEEKWKTAGFLCCLDVSDKVAYERIRKEGLPPFLKEEKDPFTAFCRMNCERRKLFREKSDLVFDPALLRPSGEPDPEETAQFIWKSYCKKTGRN